MKILLIQLARFGDIFQSWPSIRALKRTYPECEIHVLVRSKFASAIELLPEVDRIWTLDSEKILKASCLDHRVGLTELHRVINDLSNEKFDYSINLTFSNFSSYLNFRVHAKAKRGYGRHKDGTPTFADSASAYFYSQVGVGLSNRTHVCDLFARVCGVELKLVDWNFQKFSRLREKYIVAHLGASHPKKCLPIQIWADVIGNLGAQVKLIGSSGEADLADHIIKNCGSHVENLVGKTSFQETFDIIARARLFVGCDSGPLQIASIVNTRSLNLSFRTVNFWETGPKAVQSAVLYADKPSQMSSERIYQTISKMLDGERMSDVISIADPVSTYEDSTKDLGWELIQFIYFAGATPQLMAQDLLTASVIEAIARELIKCIKALQLNPANHPALDRLNTLEAKLSTLKETNLRPLISWFEAERILIPPADFKMVASKMNIFYLKLQTLARNLIDRSKEAIHGNYQMES